MICGSRCLPHVPPRVLPQGQGSSRERVSERCGWGLMQ
jgi:hypothetical protein